MYPRYEEDFYGWAMANGQLMREGRMNELDLENLIEEIESMGRSEKHQLISRLSVLIEHLLKWQYQPDFRGRSWHGSIKEQRKRLKILIRLSPSLKSKISEALIDAYDISLSLIEKETPINLKTLPLECPYTFEQCLDDDFYPS